MSSLRALAWTVAVLILVALLVPHREAVSQSMREVFVNNFPATQTISGTIAIEDPIPHARMVSFEGQLVSPVQRSEITNFTEAGTVETKGYTSLVASIQGEVKGVHFQEGKVGLLLLPDVEPVIRAFDEESEILLPIEVTADVVPGTTGYFTGQGALPIGFNRYRVYLYNTGSKSVEANVYLYLRH